MPRTPSLFIIDADFKQSEMKKTGLNSCWSWFIAVNCSVIFTLFAIIYRQSAILYAALIEKLDVDRKSASIPFVVFGFVRCFSGLTFGFLGEKLGLQRVLYIGCYISALGIGLSFFAEDILSLSITLGLIHGFGITASALLSCVVRDHFDASATSISIGIVNTGPTLSAIIFPGLVLYLIEEYGLHGTFLLLSGILLNAIPLLMLLKKPKTESSIRRISTADIENKADNVEQKAGFEKWNKTDKECAVSKTKDDPSNIDEESNNYQQTHLYNKPAIVKISMGFVKKQSTKCLKHNINNCSCILEQNKLNPQHNFENNIQALSSKYIPTHNTEMHENDKFSRIKLEDVDISCTSFNQNQDNEGEQLTKNKLDKTENSNKNFSHSLNVLKDPTFLALEDTDLSGTSNSLNQNQQDNDGEQSTKNNIEKTENSNKNFFHSLNVLKDPTFLALTLIQGIFAYTFNVWITTMIDYSRDKGIDRSYEMYFLVLNPIVGLIASLSLNWVTDKEFLSPAQFCSFLHILLALSSICMAIANDFIMMLFGILLMALALGSYVILCAVMSYAYIEKSMQIVSISSLGLLYAPLSFTVSPLIGLFREKLGSYDGLYYLLAAMNIACSLIALLLPKFANIRKRRDLKKCKNGID